MYCCVTETCLMYDISVGCGCLAIVAAAAFCLTCKNSFLAQYFQSMHRGWWQMEHGCSRNGKSTEPREELEPKDRTWSPLCGFGGVFEKADIEQTLCKICRQQVITSESNTFNLLYHLKSRHEYYSNNFEINHALKLNHKVMKRKTHNKHTWKSWLARFPVP